MLTLKDISYNILLIINDKTIKLTLTLQLFGEITYLQIINLRGTMWRENNITK
jgi:hypothetical protein